jgi:hypothetical protein
MPYRLLIVRVLPALCALLTSAIAARAQDPTPRAADTTQNAALRVYLDCSVHGCDDDHMKTEMTWVNWMRERQDADFHMLVTSEQTGGGGRRYVVVAIGQRAYAGHTDTLEFTSKPDEVVDVLRTSLLRLIGQLLVPHAAKGPLGSQLSVAFKPAEGGASSSAPARDKWNFWNFTISGNAFVNGESQQSFVDAFTEVGANRTTERWKIRTNFYQQVSRQRFVYQVDTGTSPNTDTLTIVDVGRQRSAFGSAYVARSYGEHWSLGARTIVGTSRYNNLELASQLTAAVEWNLYPFKDYTRRRLTVLYTAGVRSLDYQDTTIYGKLAETRPIQTLHATIGAKQRWGEANVTLSGSQYLDALKFYSLGLNGNISVNVARGLSFETGGSFSRVRNQLYLSSVGLTPQDVLLRQRARATNYRYFTFFGLQYRFGSIFNSVVNSRFGSINGTDDF